MPFILNPNYTKALDLFHAQKDDPSTGKSLEFYTLGLSGEFIYDFKDSSILSNYHLSFDGQQVYEPLYGVDQFSVGGLYSVRGFKEGAISGDAGFYLRNNLELKVGSKILSYFSSDNIPKFLSKLSNFYITPFYDYGYVRSQGGQSGRLSGTGAKLVYDGDNFDASLTASWAVLKSHSLGNQYNENSAMFFNLSYTL